MATVWTEISDEIGRATREPFAGARARAVGGGCINETFLLEGRERGYFVKLNAAGTLPMFESEAAGLAELAESGTVKVPLPVVWGTAGDRAFIVLEALDLRGRGSDAGWKRLGESLAAMHRVTRDQFGWHSDNTIGSTPQINSPSDDWVTFFRDNRLGFQFDRAVGRGGKDFEGRDELLEKLPEFFRDYRPAPSLLHGDLWGGNISFDASGEPVIYDPASYFGDRETDLAFTECFGALPGIFYRSYNESYPLEPGYGRRKHIYNLYHVLNHFNLFGGGYAVQAQGMINQILSTAP